MEAELSFALSSRFRASGISVFSMAFVSFLGAVSTTLGALDESSTSLSPMPSGSSAVPSPEHLASAGSPPTCPPDRQSRKEHGHAEVLPVFQAQGTEKCSDCTKMLEQFKETEGPVFEATKLVCSAEFAAGNDTVQERIDDCITNHFFQQTLPLFLLSCAECGMTDGQCLHCAACVRGASRNTAEAWMNLTTAQACSQMLETVCVGDGDRDGNAGKKGEVNLLQKAQDVVSNWMPRKAGWLHEQRPKKEMC